MRTECPECGHEQKPNCEIGDLDVCDECGEKYMQFRNMVSDK